jgi:hypothetical protein
MSFLKTAFNSLWKKVFPTTEKEVGGSKVQPFYLFTRIFTGLFTGLSWPGYFRAFSEISFTASLPKTATVGLANTHIAHYQLLNSASALLAKIL